MSIVTYTCFDGELVEENRDGTILDYVPDSLGSIIMWVDESGLPVSYTPYWPYGEPWQEPEVECPFQFVGKFGYYRDLSGTYVRAREYEPEIGRWLTVDPLWPAAQAIGYAGQSPCTLKDVSGLAPMQVSWSCDKVKNLIEPGIKSICDYISKISDGGGTIDVHKLLECAIKKLPKGCKGTTLKDLPDLMKCLKVRCLDPKALIQCHDNSDKKCKGNCAYTECSGGISLGVVICLDQACKFPSKGGPTVDKGCGPGASPYGVKCSAFGKLPGLGRVLLHELMHDCVECKGGGPGSKDCRESLTDALACCFAEGMFGVK